MGWDGRTLYSHEENIPNPVPMGTRRPGAQAIVLAEDTAVRGPQRDPVASGGKEQTVQAKP